jgi:hypothetical protein
VGSSTNVNANNNGLALNLNLNHHHNAHPRVKVKFDYKALMRQSVVELLPPEGLARQLVTFDVECVSWFHWWVPTIFSVEGQAVSFTLFCLYSCYHGPSICKSKPNLFLLFGQTD